MHKLVAEERPVARRERSGQRGRAEWWLLAGVVAFLSLVLVMWRVGGRRAPAPGAVQSQAPEFDLPLLTGARLRLGELRGRVVLVHFWATWCAPCVEEAPLLARLQDGFRDRPFDVVAVSVDDPPEPVRGFFGAAPPRYAVVLNPGGSVAREYGTFKYPETYLVGTRGQILRRYVGAQNWNSPQIAAELEAALSLN